MNNQSGDLPVDFVTVVEVLSSRAEPSLSSLPSLCELVVALSFPLAFALRFFSALVRLARSDAHDRARKMNLKNRYIVSVAHVLEHRSSGRRHDNSCPGRQYHYVSSGLKLTIPHPTTGIFFKASFKRIITPRLCPE